MFHLGSQTPNLRLQWYTQNNGVLRVTWSVEDDSHDTFGLVITMSLTDGRCLRQTLQAPCSPVSIDVASLSRVVGDSRVQVTAELCRLLPGTPKVWRKLDQTATVDIDVGSAADHDEDLPNVLRHHLSRGKLNAEGTGK